MIFPRIQFFLQLVYLRSRCQVLFFQCTNNNVGVVRTRFIHEDIIQEIKDSIWKRINGKKNPSGSPIFQGVGAVRLYLQIRDFLRLNIIKNFCH